MDLGATGLKRFRAMVGVLSRGIVLVARWPLEGVSVCFCFFEGVLDLLKSSDFRLFGAASFFEGGGRIFPERMSRILLYDLYF